MMHGTADKVTSHISSETFCERVEADDKKLTLYEGCYHELHNEIDGVPEKEVEEVVTWIEARCGATASAKL